MITKLKYHGTVKKNPSNPLGISKILSMTHPSLICPAVNHFLLKTKTKKKEGKRKKKVMALRLIKLKHKKSLLLKFDRNEWDRNTLFANI